MPDRYRSAEGGQEHRVASCCRWARSVPVLRRPGCVVTAITECASCGEGDPRNECPQSKRPCGHHCNHVWTHDSCDWCGFTYEGDT